MKLSIQNMVVLSDAQNKKIIKKGKKSVNQMTTLFLSNSWPINSLSFDFFIGPIHIPGIPILSFDQIPTPIVFPTRVFSQPKKKIQFLVVNLIQ